MDAPETPNHIGAADYARRLRALLGGGGLRVGFPRKRRDLWILLHACATRFAPGDELSEPEANGRIGAFLLTFAGDWSVDRVTVRRALVDEGFLDRESDGTRYRPSTRHHRRVTFDPAPDPATILAGE